MSKNLKQTEVEVKSILGEGAIAINEFLALKQNDVITLDQKIDLPLRLTINNEAKFLVQPGKYKNKMSVQILDEIKRGEQYDE